MVAGIAHDLRTPLTSVKGYVEGLRDGIADTPEKQQRYLDTIYDSTCGMESMLNDLLTVSKLELGTIELHKEKICVSDFKEVAEQLGKELTLDGFEFEYSDNTKTNPAILVDTDRFSRVVDNIISNSIKYRREGVQGKICLSISEYERSVIVEIADNGMGVEPESLPRIFDTLYRADKARTNVSDGSGLGLSVCKQLVEMHGGMIWAQNNSMGGLSIFISLPKFEEDN
jgi:signal transduction histidine kinase